VVKKGLLMKKLEAEVYQTETAIVIVGNPEENDPLHNCDAMGCGQEHVLYRFKLPIRIDITKAMQAARGYRLHYEPDGSVKIIGTRKGN
jgi:hypothetical protein